MRKFILVNTLFLLVLIVSCSKEPQKIDFKYKDYDDPYKKYSLKIPDGWISSETETSMKFFSSQSSYEKFMDPSSPGAVGAMLTIETKKVDFLNDLQKGVSIITESEKEIIPQFEKTEDSKFAGKDAKKLSYRFKVTEQLIINGTKYVLVSDSILYHIDYKVFDEVAVTYQPAYDEIVKSFIVLAPKVLAKGQLEPPSEKFEKYDNTYFSLNYPDNFNTKFPKSSFLFTGNFIGLRQDCNLQVDIFPAKGLTTEKVFSQNKDKFPGAKGSGEKQINGNKALFVNYSPVKGINSRAYFTVKGDKVYRLTLNWATTEETTYLPVFDKVLNSFVIK